MKSNRAWGMFFLDFLILNVSFFGYYAFRHGFNIVSYKYIFFLIAANLIWLFISVNTHLHVLNARSRIIRSMQVLFVSYASLSVALIAILAVYGDFKNYNKYLLVPLLCAGIVSSCCRLFYLVAAKHIVSNGYGRKSALVIGGDRVSERVIYKILRSPYLGYNLFGVLADHYHESLPKGIYLGKLERFSEVVQSNLVDEVIIALPLRREEELIEIVEKCNYEGIRFRIVPDYFRLVQNKMETELLDDIPMLTVQTEPLRTFGNQFQKRCFDIVFSLLVLTVLSPLYLIIALLIKTTSAGPVIFKQKRIGANNKEFVIYKFRSMATQSSTASDTTWTKSEDHRITGIGRFLRKTNLDEFPQFWNVLIGDMSIVGPRPERQHFVEQFKEEISNYKTRHLIKSGITGWAQVNGLRGDSSISERIRYDIFYMQHWSIWLDIKIILLTIFCRKAYQNAY